jgi:hypothetical protein
MTLPSTPLNRKYNDAALEQLKRLGAQLIPIHLPKLPSYDMSLLLVCEGASAFEDLTLSNKDDLMVQQNKASMAQYISCSAFHPCYGIHQGK